MPSLRIEALILNREGNWGGGAFKQRQHKVRFAFLLVYFLIFKIIFIYFTLCETVLLACMYVYMYVCVYAMCVLVASRGQRRTWDPLGLELEMVGNHHVGAGNRA